MKHSTDAHARPVDTVNPTVHWTAAPAMAIILLLTPKIPGLKVSFVCSAVACLPLVATADDTDCNSMM